MYHFRQPQLQFIYLLNKINVNNSQLPDLRQLATIHQLNQLIYKTEPTRLATHVKRVYHDRKYKMGPCRST